MFKKDDKNIQCAVVGLPSQAYIIAEIIKGCHYKEYLELGIYFGTTYNYIKPFVKNAYGVDMENKDFIDKKHFYCMSTDDFFKKNKKTFDVIFIDACHEFKQVVKDFENAVKVLNVGGTIFLHDTDPYSREYMKPNFCNNCYKMNKYIIKQNKYQLVTIPMDECGMSIVRIKDDNRHQHLD